MSGKKKNLDKATRSIEGETFAGTPEPPEMKNVETNAQKIPDARTIKIPFSQTALGRTLRGRNRVGRVLHAVIDILPIPNFHEIVKSVIKDEEAQGVAIKLNDVIAETVRKFDWMRTGIAVFAGWLFLNTDGFFGIEPDAVLGVIEIMLNLFSNGS